MECISTKLLLVKNPEVRKTLSVRHFRDVDPDEINWPQQLEELNFHHDNYKPDLEKKVVFPDSLISLYLTSNCSLDLYVFPKSLKKLTVDGSFVCDFKKIVLPDGLTHLSLGYWFDKDLRGVNLPDSLTHLSLGDCFNREIKDLNLPDGLVYLRLGNMFNREVNNAGLPDSLTYLNLGNRFNR